MTELIKLHFKYFAVAMVLVLLVLTSLIAIGVLSQVWAWVGFLIVSGFIVTSPTVHAVYFVILALPFSIVLQNPWIANLPMWRMWFLILFGLWITKQFWKLVSSFSKDRQQFPNSQDLGFAGVIKSTVLKITKQLNPWDKYILGFFAVALVSIIFSTFPTHGLKQLLFLVNISLLYIVITFEFKLRNDILLFRKVVASSLSIIVGLGFVQYFATFFSDPYYFWQYWALLVQKAYYGVPLAEVLLYSNSWFSSGSGAKALRMFGVLPDTHSFGMLAVFALLIFTSYLKKTEISESAVRLTTRIKNFFKQQNNFVITGLLLTSLAVVLSGTRGIWVGMLPLLVFSISLIWKKIVSGNLKLILFAQILVIVWLVVSPFLSVAFNWVRSFDVNDDLYKRASSIYDLSESSNVGRLQIWQESASFAVMNPLGTGYGNFIVSVIPNITPGSNYDDLSSSVNKRYNLPQEFVTAHNLYLHILVELGVVGVIAFALVVLSMAKQIWQNISRSLLDEKGLQIVLSLSFALLWLLSYGFFDLTILNDKVLIFTFLLLSIVGATLKIFRKKHENLAD